MTITIQKTTNRTKKTTLRITKQHKQYNNNNGDNSHKFTNNNTDNNWTQIIPAV